jgi:Alg9-like mannosyltransferase family
LDPVLKMHKTRGSKTSSQTSEKSKENITDDIPPMDDESQHPSNIKLKTYWVLVVLRFFLAIVPQNGYIQPDEFFQSVEVVAGKEKNNP